MSVRSQDAPDVERPSVQPSTRLSQVLQAGLRECSTGMDVDPSDRIAVRLTFMEDYYPNRVLIFITTYFAHGANDMDTWQARGGLAAEQDQHVIDRIRQYLVKENVAVLEPRPSEVYNLYRANDILSKDTLAEKSFPYMMQLAKDFGATPYVATNLKTATITFLKDANDLIPAAGRVFRGWS